MSIRGNNAGHRLGGLAGLGGYTQSASGGGYTGKIIWDHITGMSTQGADSSGLYNNNSNWGTSFCSAVAQGFTGAGYVEYRSVAAASNMQGLTDHSSDTSYDTIRYAMDLQSSGGVGIYENGVARGTFGTTLGNGTDVLRVNVAANGTVTYLLNGTVIYTSGLSATGLTLYPAAAGFNSGSQFGTSVVSH